MKAEESSIVADYRSGNTRIKISDACYHDRTEADIAEILNRIADNAQRAFISAEMTPSHDNGNAMEDTTKHEDKA